MTMISKIDCRGMSILVGPQNLMDLQLSNAIGDGLGEHDGAEVRLIWDPYAAYACSPHMNIMIHVFY